MIVAFPGYIDWLQVVCHLRFPFDSILEAVFTVSPKRQYLGIVKPTTPATTEPVCKPGRNKYTLICIRFNRNATIISIYLTKMSNFGDCPIRMVRKCFDYIDILLKTQANFPLLLQYISYLTICKLKIPKWVHLQTVKTQIKYSIILHFIRVCTVC